MDDERPRLPWHWSRIRCTYARQYRIMLDMYLLLMELYIRGGVTYLAIINKLRHDCCVRQHAGVEALVSLQHILFVDVLDDSLSVALVHEKVEQWTVLRAESLERV